MIIASVKHRVLVSYYCLIFSLENHFSWVPGFHFCPCSRPEHACCSSATWPSVPCEVYWAGLHLPMTSLLGAASWPAHCLLSRPSNSWLSCSSAYCPHLTPFPTPPCPLTPPCPPCSSPSATPCDVRYQHHRSLNLSLWTTLGRWYTEQRPGSQLKR